jgi:hypothetical protein
MISHEHRCIFIHIPKCAGTSIASVLGHFEGHRGRGWQDHRSVRMIEQPLFTPHILSSTENLTEVLRRFRHRYQPATNYRNKFTVSRDQFERYFKFAFVRNPWSRAFSWYRNVMRDEFHRNEHGIGREMGLNEYLRAFAGTGSLRPQVYWLKNFKGAIALDFIGRFENLVRDTEYVFEKLNIRADSLPPQDQGR